MRPTDCALIVTVPLERAEFLADLARGTDFLMQFAARQRTRDVDTLWSLYEAGVALIRHGIARAQRRGVWVWTRSTATDFTQCLRQHLVVTLVAHWRSARFRAGDVLDPQGVIVYCRTRLITPARP